jgi:hypothetical protein
VKSQALMLIVTMGGFALPAHAQDPPPVTPPPVSQPPSTSPATAPSPVPTGDLVAVSAAAPVAVAAPVPLSEEGVRRRLEAIYYLESSLIAAVKLAAQQTATEIRRVQPGLMMFSSAPVKAHGTYLEGYGVVFHIEIPQVMPSVASLMQSIEQERNPAQRAGVPGPPLNPNAHYVQSIKTELINTMVKLSQALELQPGETLTVSARDGSEIPGQVAPPSTMTLQVKGRDLTDFTAGRITLNDVIRRVTVRGF